MQRRRYYYLLELQFLGFRYHGWQKQPGVKTVEEMLLRTISYVLGRKGFKVLASGRTDAMVSAQHALVELFLDDEPLPEEFLEQLNSNLPADLRALTLEEVDEDFNVIEAPAAKEYLYLFCCGDKMHPFAAPFMTWVKGPLDIDLMQQGASLFEGSHDFVNFTYKPRPNTRTQGSLEVCEIVENTFFTASFFPSTSFALRIKGKGFKRHQVRLMMGALFDLGSGHFDLEFLTKAIAVTERIHMDRVAPASGLILHRVHR